MAIGFIKLHRQVVDSFIYPRKDFSYFEAWIDLLLLVNYKSVETLDGVLKAGQYRVSLSFLQKRWGWKSDKKVRTFLKKMEQHEAISWVENGHSKKNLRGRIIKVNNWDKFQSMDEAKTELGRSSDGVGTELGREEKKGKKEKKDKKSFSPNPSIIDFGQEREIRDLFEKVKRGFSTKAPCGIQMFVRLVGEIQYPDDFKNFSNACENFMEFHNNLKTELQYRISLRKFIEEEEWLNFIEKPIVVDNSKEKSDVDLMIERLENELS